MTLIPCISEIKKWASLHGFCSSLWRSLNSRVFFFPVPSVSKGDLDSKDWYLESGATEVETKAPGERWHFQSLNLRDSNLHFPFSRYLSSLGFSPMFWLQLLAEFWWYGRWEDVYACAFQTESLNSTRGYISSETTSSLEGGRAN